MCASPGMGCEVCSYSGSQTQWKMENWIADDLAIISSRQSITVPEKAWIGLKGCRQAPHRRRETQQMGNCTIVFRQTESQTLVCLLMRHDEVNYHKCKTSRTDLRFIGVEEETVWYYRTLEGEVKAENTSNLLQFWRKIALYSDK